MPWLIFKDELWTLVTFNLPAFHSVTFLSSWMMHSSLQNLLFIFSCACFKAESIISCATWHARDRVFLFMKTVTVIMKIIGKIISVNIKSSCNVVFSTLIYLENGLQYCHPQLWYFFLSSLLPLCTDNVLGSHLPPDSCL